jgi:hypothetical protein
MSLVKFDSQLHNEYKYGNIKLSKDRENNLNMMHTDPNTSYLLGTELSLSSRGRMTLGVGEIFWFISHTLPQCHALQGVGDTYL